MKKLILIMILFTPFILLSQIKTKETVYLLFNKNNKKKCLIENGSGKSVEIKKFRKKVIKNKIFFSVCNEDFIYIKGVYKTDTCSVRALNNLKIVSLDYLLKRYYEGNDHKHQLFEKIYFIEKINENKIVKYEVYWSGEWTIKD